MKRIRIPHTDLDSSRIALGCMNLGGWEPGPVSAEQRRRALELVDTALELGIDFFDHADIYGRGRAEEAFSGIWDVHPGLRERIIVQSKCGIRFAGDPNPDSPERYDFSYHHIISSVEGSLRRLKTDYLDILLLHRPDALVEPEEVARALDELLERGLIRHVGVSNHDIGQIELLRHHLKMPLVANQLELNLLHNHLIDSGIAVNVTRTPVAGAYAAGVSGLLDYGRLHGLMLQAWSPLARGVLSSPPADAPPHVQATAALVAEMAAAKGCSREAIVTGWLLRHPAGIQPVVGTTRPERLRAICEADEVELSHEEWYRLFTAARGEKVP